MAVHVKEAVLPGSVEPADGVRRAGRPLPSLLVVLALVVLVLVLVLVLVGVLVEPPEPAPVVYWTSVEDQRPLVYRHCKRTHTVDPFVGIPEAV